MSATLAETRAVATRIAYRDWVVARMLADRRVVCLDTDTGLFTGVSFGAAGDRYVDLGIAEHTLMGVAAGLAADGWIPYVNTMAAFAATRALEAVKINIAYNSLPVRIVATHSGVSAGHLGPTHHALEDLSVMRTLPNMTVAVPAGVRDTLCLLEQTAELPGPAYLRLGRKPTPEPVAAGEPELGVLQRLRPGRRVVLLAVGPLPLLAATGAAEALAEDGHDVGLLHGHTLKPFDRAGLLAATSDADLVVTVEEHWPTGGLGTVVAECLAEAGPGGGSRRLLRLGPPDGFVGTVGDQRYLLERFGITPTAIAARVRTALETTTR
jgi:transketolase